VSAGVGWAKVDLCALMHFSLSKRAVAVVTVADKAQLGTAIRCMSVPVAAGMNQAAADVGADAACFVAPLSCDG